MEKCQEAWVVQQLVYKDQAILSHKNPFYRLPQLPREVLQGFQTENFTFIKPDRNLMFFFPLTGETKSQHKLSRPQVDVIKHVSDDK